MCDKFQTISTILPDVQKTWENKLFLTLDVDWACDEVINDSIDLIEKADIAATWFITHASPVLNRLRQNPKFELGIHPNFNPILENNNFNKTAVEEVIDKLLEIVPEAKSVRSHSMLQSSKLLEVFYKRGLLFDANHYIPENSGIIIKPWKLWTGGIKVPHFWEDDLTAIYDRFDSFNSLKEKAGLKVFDFHPIHIFLNMSKIDQYERTREFHRDPESLVLQRNNLTIGTRDVLHELITWK